MEEEHAAYERGLAAGPRIPAGSDVDLEMRVRLVDGDTVISDTAEDAGLAVRDEWFSKSLCRRTTTHRARSTSTKRGYSPSLREFPTTRTTSCC